MLDDYLLSWNLRDSNPFLADVFHISVVSKRSHVYGGRLLIGYKHKQNFVHSAYHPFALSVIMSWPRSNRVYVDIYRHTLLLLGETFRAYRKRDHVHSNHYLLMRTPMNWVNIVLLDTKMMRSRVHSLYPLRSNLVSIPPGRKLKRMSYALRHA